MAQIINLRESEYQTIVSEMIRMHEEHILNVDSIITEMKTLVTSKDIFSTDLTSKKMVDILDVLSNDVMTLLKQAFRDSEAGVENMIESTMTTDSVRG